jgi:hypothetical protein
VFLYSIGHLVWSCKKQNLVSLSTTRAEYRGVVEACTETICIHRLLSEPGFPFQASNIIFFYNQISIQDADNPIVHSKMNHVELHAHYLQQLVHDDVVSLEYCCTKDQVVDIFAKPLVESIFIKLHTLLGIQEVAIMGGVLQ